MRELCYSHSDQPAAGRCSTCNKPFCSDCREEDVASEKAYCSRTCREEARVLRPGVGCTSNAELAQGLQTPVRTGWSLWLRSIGALGLQTAPVAAAVGLLLATSPELSADDVEETSVPFMLAVAVGAFGLALVQVVLTQRYTGHAPGHSYLWTVRRFGPWLLTLALAWPVIVAGYFLFVIPGAYLALRLFWAGEFALVHGAGPWRGLKESWNLTEGSAGELFGFQLLLRTACSWLWRWWYSAAATSWRFYR